MYPTALRDLFMWLAEKNLFRPRWSDHIHAEWIRNVLADKPQITAERLQTTRKLMDRTPEALVTGYEALIPAIELTAKEDRHVVAAAVLAKADAIVTFNLRDFPEEELGRYDLEAIHPDEFLLDLLHLDSAAVLRVVRTIQTGLRNPPISLEQLLAHYERLDLGGFASEVRRLQEGSV